MKTLSEEPDPTQRTYELLIQSCIHQNSLADARWVHQHLLEIGFDQDAFLATKLINMYSSMGLVCDARKVFDKMPRRTIFVYNALFRALSLAGLGDEVLDLYRRMPVKNVVSWSAMIACYAKNEMGFEALELFREMVVRIGPNSVTMVSVLQACGALGALEQGKMIHGYIVRNGLDSILPVVSGLVTMYTRCGKLEVAKLVFDKMCRRDVVSWNALISGYGAHGYGRRALEVFDEMVGCGVSPSNVSFVSVLGACSHVGLVDEGRALFDSMRRYHGMFPTVDHYAAMVDLLGRANRLEEAARFIEGMRIEPGPKVWGALLGSCRIHCNVELAEWASGKLFELEPMNAGNYVLLADVYAGAGMWDEVKRVKKLMESKGLQKLRGRSWIEAKREVHWFASVDEFNPRMEQLHAMVSELSSMMKEDGYVPRTNVVLYDLEEEEKERILLGHSEKLALAFGLINTSNAEPIRITKNLRLCEDCHSFTKYISKLARKEILVRDVNRFHHFRDGVCSCGDFW
ncbi:Pentatricopeptide repeat-containing protein At3g46790, chloroplastic [Linum perenne]